MTPSESPSNKGGRPSKFAEPSRPVTVTLPLRILDHLAGIDADRAKAIVRAVEAALASHDPSSPVREMPFSDDENLLTVADNRFLRRIPWLSLVPVTPGRFLISLKPGVPVEKLEVTLGDLIDAPSDATPAELDALRKLLVHLRTPRRNRAVRSESILVIRKTSP